MNGDDNRPGNEPKRGQNKVVRVLLGIVAFVVVAVLLFAGTCALIVVTR